MRSKQKTTREPGFIVIDSLNKTNVLPKDWYLLESDAVEECMERLTVDGCYSKCPDWSVAPADLINGPYSGCVELRERPIQ